MKNQIQIISMAALVVLGSCSKEKQQEVSSANLKTDPMAIQTPVDSSSAAAPASSQAEKSNADWYGTYEAVVPCADCPGIQTTLTLEKDNSFQLQEEYLERKSKNKDHGTYIWNAATDILELKGNDTHYKYKVGNNTLTQLDMNGQPVEGPNKDLYVFKKKQ
ncbi:copper resistance protein NlpE [Chryseobacterium camelliae]|uniref:copper resistance protein NlpE n=1 Tax=Chryseobacterium camelliae TaxID=1265445 RepID=UPI000C1CA892|nr:copper resistance protein NlpE [Chryseobacterium camelliae]